MYYRTNLAAEVPILEIPADASTLSNMRHHSLRSLRLWWGVAALGCFLPMGAGALAGQASTAMIVGTVTDASTGSPVPLVTVSLNGGAVLTATRYTGGFRVGNAGFGTNVLELRRIGYKPMDIDIWVERGDTLFELSIAMEPAPTQLDPVVVNAEAAPANRKLIAFEERRRRGFGHFVTPELIEKWNPVDVVGLLQVAPGVLIYPNAAYGSRDPRRYIVKSTRTTAGFLRGECPMLLFLDGMYVGTTGIEDIPIEQSIPLAVVAAVEVYSGAAQIPPEFNRTGADCGVMVFWTK